MPDNRPNILLIMTDQQRGDALGIEGHPVLQTPNMDHLAQTGTRFSHAYTTCPVCIPARRSLMSGQHPSTHGMVGYADGLEWECPNTLPGELQKAGYQTGIVGRNMHLWPRWKRYGFDQQRIMGGVKEKGDYELWMEQYQPEGAGGFRGGGVMNNDWTARPWHMPEQCHPTHWTINEAIDFLKRRDRSMPYFLVVSFVAPHPPLNPPQFYFDRYLRQDIPAPVIGDWASPPPNEGMGVRVDSDEVNLTGEALKSAQAGYYGLINHVDDQIRRILNPVDRLVDDNTVVMFTSDHGEMLGDHYLFRKSQPYEGSARIPLLVRGTRDRPLGQGQVLGQAVCLEDIMPTALELAGVDIPDSVDGKSLVPMLEGGKPNWRECLHGEHSGRAHFLTDGKMKFVWVARTGEEQLFDLDDDPNELTNLVKRRKHADAVKTWRDRLIDKLKDRPEGFVKDGKLVAGRPYGAMIPREQAAK